MGSPLVLAGVASTGTVGALRLHYPPLAPQKSRRTMAHYKNVGLDPVGAPHAYEKQEVGKPSRNTAQPCAVYDDPYRGDELRDGWAFSVGTWNVDSPTGRLGELVEVLAERRMDVLCVQETRWRIDCRLFGAIGKKYKLFLMGKTDGVGIFVAEKWAESVVRVEKHSERIMVLKMVLGDRLLNVFFGICSSLRET